MSYEQISAIVFKEAEAFGYKVTERRSLSTNSVYYTIYAGKVKLMFRVSDHGTNKNVITLRIDHKNVSKIAVSFVKNRIKDLRYRNLKSVLGM